MGERLRVFISEASGADLHSFFRGHHICVPKGHSGEEGFVLDFGEGMVKCRKCGVEERFIRGEVEEKGIA